MLYNTKTGANLKLYCLTQNFFVIFFILNIKF